MIQYRKNAKPDKFSACHFVTEKIIDFGRSLDCILSLFCFKQALVWAPSLVTWICTCALPWDYAPVPQRKKLPQMALLQSTGEKSRSMKLCGSNSQRRELPARTRPWHYWASLNLSSLKQLLKHLKTVFLKQKWRTMKAGCHMCSSLKTKPEKWKMQACRTQTHLKSMILGTQWTKGDGKRAKSCWERRRKGGESQSGDARVVAPVGCPVTAMSMESQRRWEGCQSLCSDFSENRSLLL